MVSRVGGAICDKRHLAAVVRILLEEAAEGAKLLRQALGVVEPVDADEADGRAGLLAAALRAQAGEGIDVDADREAGDRQLAVESADAAVLQDAPEHAVLQVVDEVADIHLRLQADEIVGGEAARQLAMLGNGEERLRRRHRDVQEKADGVGDAERAQLHAERDHVIVVHPDDVVRLQQRTQRLGEALVDVEIALVVAGLELRDVEPGVEHRPQHVVGIARVVLVVLARAERQGRDGRAAELGEVGRRAQLFAAVADLAAPAEPKALARAQSVGDGDGDPAGLASLTEVGDAIGDENDAAHNSPVGRSAE